VVNGKLLAAHHEETHELRRRIVGNGIEAVAAAYRCPFADAVPLIAREAHMDPELLNAVACGDRTPTPLRMERIIDAVEALEARAPDRAFRQGYIRAPYGTGVKVSEACKALVKRKRQARRQGVHL
jgi:hypothetical protein